MQLTAQTKQPLGKEIQPLDGKNVRLVVLVQVKCHCHWQQAAQRFSTSPLLWILVPKQSLSLGFTSWCFDIAPTPQVNQTELRGLCRFEQTCTTCRCGATEDKMTTFKMLVIASETHARSLFTPPPIHEFSHLTQNLDFNPATGSKEKKKAHYLYVCQARHHLLFVPVSMECAINIFFGKGG